jgi:hypothetical protein
MPRNAAHRQRPSLADVARAILGRKVTLSDPWLVRGLLRLQERLRYGYMAEMDQPGRAEMCQRLERYHRMAAELEGLFGGADMATLAFLDAAAGATPLDVFATAKGLQEIAARLEREVQRRLPDKSKGKRGGRGRAWATNGAGAKRECAAAVVAAYRKICESHDPSKPMPPVKVIAPMAGQLWYAAIGEHAGGWRDLVTWAASDDAAETRKLVLRFFKGGAARSPRPPILLRYLTGNGA